MNKYLLTLLLVVFSLTSLADEYSHTPKLGDVNDDGKIDKADISCVISHILGWTPASFNVTTADANEDGKINVADVTSIISIMLNAIDECRYFHDETTGDEAIISAAGDVMIQRSNDEGGYTLQMCSYDFGTEEWSTEKCVLAELDKEDHLRSIIYSDFSLLFLQSDAGKTNIAIIRYDSGEYELLGQIEEPANSRAFENNYLQSLADRAAAVYDFWGLVEEPVKAKLTSGELNKVKWTADLWISLAGKLAEIGMESVGSDFSTTTGNAVTLLAQAIFNLVVHEAAFSNPITAALFLMKALEEGKQHILNELIGKDLAVSSIETKRLTWDSYKAAYVVSGISAAATHIPEIDFIYYPRSNNAGWAVFPQTITHTCQNQAYTQEISDLAPGPNELLLNVYIEGYRILGPFISQKAKFFVGLNSLSEVEIGEFERNSGIITQKILAYSVNHNEAYPLSDFGTYIRLDDVIQRYPHTENVINSDISVSGPSISGVNTVTQELLIEIDEKELVEVNDTEKEPKREYYIGAYSYNFKTGDYEYYDEQQLELKYNETACPDENHPHWIDLGLPSGTKWACCNVGASAPEQYGGYYTFGQVGSAPSLYQIKELLNNCTSVWTTLDGVNGRKFTGPNNCTIFLPAAGVRWGGELGSLGFFGGYWSSTPYDEVCAYGFYFHPSLVEWGNSLYRNDARPVRPVR